MSEFPPHPTSGSQHKVSAVRKGSAARTWRRFLPVVLERGPLGLRLRIRWRALMVAAVLGAVFGYLGLAAGAYAFVKYQRGMADVRFLDILLPNRWSHYKIARGNHHIAQAQAQLQASQYREAFQNLRVGLAKSPANRDGRLLLAQFFVASRRSDLAQRLLLEGIPYHANDLEYLKTVFSFLLQHQEDAEAARLATSLLPADAPITARNQLVALAAASADYFRGNYDRAEERLEKFRLVQTRDGRLLAARIQWERGQRDAALQQLQALAGELPRDDEIYTTLVSWLRETGRDDEARRASLMRQLEEPRNPRPQIDLLYAYQKSGDTARATAATEELLREFGHDQTALLALADFAANSGNPTLARRIYDLCRSRNLPAEGAALMTIEAQIVARQYRPALEMIRALMKENPEWTQRYDAVFNGLQAIASYGLGDAEAAQRFLNTFLAQPNLRVENLLAVSNRLLSLGAHAQARQVLVHAATTDPRNQAALTSLIKLDLQTGNTDALPANVRRLLTMRKPSLEVLQAAYRKLGSDLFLFAPDRTALLNELRQALPSSAAATRS